jgi:hypothetical protein
VLASLARFDEVAPKGKAPPLPPLYIARSAR